MGANALLMALPNDKCDPKAALLRRTMCAAINT